MESVSLHTHFTGTDWGVLAAYLLLTTLLGHLLRGRQATIRDFFLAGRSLPWPLVAASIIATEISALTFIGVPGIVFAAGGNFTYLQWAIGSIIARFLVAFFFVRAFYEREIYSPYDYMANRLGPTAAKLATFLFSLGTVLGQSVRVLVTALILKTVTPLSMEQCIFAITSFAVLWTWMGGMTTVIWTDAIQFFLFVFSGVLALFWLVNGLPGGWDQLLQTAQTDKKLQIINLSTDPDVQFTLWVALLAMPFQNLAAFGTDQLNAQRMFCCRSSREASLAVIASCFSQVVTVLMLFVGAGLYVWYVQFPPNAAEAAAFAADRDSVFPVWITTALPPGITGLVLAGAFAAAISSLDSALAALSQTSLSFFGKIDKNSDGESGALLRLSRLVVLFWGVILAMAAFFLHAVKQWANLDLLSLAFGMVAYTYGPLLGMFLLALCGVPAKPIGLCLGVSISILLVALVRPDFYVLLQSLGFFSPAMAQQARPAISFVWLYPITTLITVSCGALLNKWPRPTETDFRKTSTGSNKN